MIYNLLVFSLTVLSLVSCSSHAKLSKDVDFDSRIISKLVFAEKAIFNKKGLNEMIDVSNIILKHYSNSEEESSEKFEKIEDTTDLKDMAPFQHDEIIIIEVKNDTIWKYFHETSNHSGNFFRFEKTTGNRFTHTSMSGPVVSHEDLFKEKLEYSKEVFANDRKEILGFDCYKIRIEEEERQIEDYPKFFGSTVFEMYVTDKIDIPAHIITHFSKYFDGFFPFEIRSWKSKMPNHILESKIISIE
jgi:hypothetical protein